MLRFTKRADYGLMAIHYIAIHDDVGTVSVKRIAEEFSIPQELLAKILQRLAKQGLIDSQNGPKGGYVLARRPTEIDVLNGGIAAEGRRAGVPTPRHDCMVALVKGLEKSWSDGPSD